MNWHQLAMALLWGLGRGRFLVPAVVLASLLVIVTPAGQASAQYGGGGGAFGSAATGPIARPGRELR